MKFKTTQKAVKNGYDVVIPIGYCAMDNLLRYRTPVSYTTRNEGWGSDVYEVNGSYRVAISTGYSPFGTIKLTLEQYQLIKDYEVKARTINEDFGMRYERRIIELDLILRQLIKELNIV